MKVFTFSFPSSLVLPLLTDPTFKVALLPVQSLVPFHEQEGSAQIAHKLTPLLL